MTNDTTQSIFRSAKRFFSGTMLSRITGMLRDMSMAYVFGAEASLAAFMLAFRFSHLLRRLLGEGALQSAFIPEFESLRHQESARAFRFFKDLSFALILLLGLIVGVGSLLLASVLIYGGLSDSNKEIIYLTLLMLPGLFFICLYGLNASLLQCEKSYFTPGVAPVAFNIIWIFVVLALRNLDHQSAMPWLALGVVIACFAQWLFTVPKSLSILRKNISEPFWKNLTFLSSDVVRLSKNLLLGITGVAATQINSTIDGIFARFAQLEGPAFLWYAIRIEQLPLALFGIALSGAILPPLSRAIKEKSMNNYHHFLHYGLKQTMELMIPLTCLLFIAGGSYVNLIFGRGDFSSDSVIETSQCLLGYSIGLLPTALVLILAPACYAHKNYHLPAYASFFTMGLNCLLNAWMIVGFKLGAMSVAVATSLAAWGNLAFLSYFLHQQGLLSGFSTLSWKFIKITIQSSISTLFSVIILSNWDLFNYSAMLNSGSASFLPRILTAQMLSALWPTIVFAFVYTLITTIFFFMNKILLQKRSIYITMTSLLRTNRENFKKNCSE